MKYTVFDLIEPVDDIINRTFNTPRSRSRAAATSKMECFVIIVNGFWLSILDFAAALDPPRPHSPLSFAENENKRSKVNQLNC